MKVFTWWLHRVFSPSIISSLTEYLVQNWKSFEKINWRFHLIRKLENEKLVKHWKREMEIVPTLIDVKLPIILYLFLACLLIHMKLNCQCHMLRILPCSAHVLVSSSWKWNLDGKAENSQNIQHILTFWLSEFRCFRSLQFVTCNSFSDWLFCALHSTAWN